MMMGEDFFAYQMTFFEKKIGQRLKQNQQAETFSEKLTRRRVFTLPSNCSSKFLFFAPKDFIPILPPWINL